MKKQIITSAILLYSIAGFSQQKQHLPKTVTITLSAQQALRLDSAVLMGLNSLDSKKASQWYQVAFEPLYTQIRQQLVTDSVKSTVPAKKK